MIYILIIVDIISGKKLHMKLRVSLEITSSRGLNMKGL